MNNIEKQLFEKYKQMQLAENEYCKECRNKIKQIIDTKPEGKISKPVCCWFVGNNYATNKKRILFIGKNARGYWCEKGEEGEIIAFQDARQVNDERKPLWEVSWPYWSYTKAITQQIFGSDSLENVAFTNLIKCNFSGDKDTTTGFMKDCCINKVGVVKEEIKIIKPTHIVIFSGTSYDEQIKNMFDKITVKNEKNVTVGKKTMPWFEAEVVLQNSSIKLLRIGHPERMKKDEFINLVTDWLITTD